MVSRLIGSLVLPDRIVQGTIQIGDGKIIAIDEGFSKAGEHVLDFRGSYLLQV